MGHIWNDCSGFRPFIMGNSILYSIIMIIISKLHVGKVVYKSDGGYWVINNDGRSINPQSGKLNNLNFRPLEVVSRYREPQLQVDENYSCLFNFRSIICKSWCLSIHYVSNNCDLTLYPQIIQSEFSPTWSCVSLTRSTTSSEWKLFRFDKMEVNCFQILLIDVTFYL